jgi:hypothetical protein
LNVLNSGYSAFIGTLRFVFLSEKIVKKISEDKEIAEMSRDEPFEFDKEELRKYLNEVIKVKRDHASE